MRADVRDWAAFERRHVHGRLSRGFGTWLFALLGTAGLTACSTQTGLMATGEPGQVCVPASVDGEATVGLDVLENFSSGPVEVTSATVADENGLRVVGRSLVEPGSPQAEVASGYAQPEASDHARMIPAGDRAILVLGLRLQSPPGTATAVTVTYLEGGREGTTQTVPPGRSARSRRPDTGAEQGPAPPAMPPRYGTRGGRDPDSGPTSGR